MLENGSLAHLSDKEGQESIISDFYNFSQAMK